MAQIGDLVKIDVIIQTAHLGHYYGCLFQSEADARDPRMGNWGIRANCEDVFLVVGRSVGHKGKKMVNVSNKSHVLELMNLRDKQVYWTEPKFVLVYQSAEGVR